LFPTAILEIGSKLIDKFFPDPEQKQKAQLELLKMQQDGELQQMQTELSVIMEEARSTDKWTSRARPAFLYVCYVLILFAIPMGLISAFSSDIAKRIAEGFGAWLAAIPSEIIGMMKFVLGGYIGARTIDKGIEKVSESFGKKKP